MCSGGSFPAGGVPDRRKGGGIVRRRNVSSSHVRQRHSRRHDPRRLPVQRPRPGAARSTMAVERSQRQGSPPGGVRAPLSSWSGHLRLFAPRKPRAGSCVERKVHREAGRAGSQSPPSSLTNDPPRFTLPFRPCRLARNSSRGSVSGPGPAPAGHNRIPGTGVHGATDPTRSPGAPWPLPHPIGDVGTHSGMDGGARANGGEYEQEGLGTSPGDCAAVTRLVCPRTGAPGRCQTAIVRIDDTPCGGFGAPSLRCIHPLPNGAVPRPYPPARLSPVVDRSRAVAT